MSSSLPLPHLLALDWGTSRLRAFLMCAGEVVAERESAHGIQHLPEPGPGGYATALAQLAGDWLEHQPELPLLACGMVGSAQGWREAPYVPCPADAAALAAQAVPVETAHGRPMWIVPGVSCDFAGAAPGRLPDVMRGEETQIVGALAAETVTAVDAEDLAATLGARRIYILPGTHSKWATVEDGRIVRFSTDLTGELYAVLRAHSILGRLMPTETAPFDDAAFARGVQVGARGDGGLTHQLFSVRTLALAGELAPAALPDYLSGLLIGHEVANELHAATALSAAVPALIGDPALCARYARAFALLAAPAPQVLSNTAPRGLWRIAQARGLIPL